MSDIEHYVRCPRQICEKGHVFETVNGIKKPPPYTCSVCRGEGFVPSTAYQGAVEALATIEAVAMLADGTGADRSRLAKVQKLAREALDPLGGE